MKSQYKASLHDILKSKPWVSVTVIQWHSVLHYKRQHLQWTKPYHPCMVLILSFLRQSLQQARWWVLTMISCVCGDQTCMAVYPLLCCRLLQASDSPAEVRSALLLTTLGCMELEKTARLHLSSSSSHSILQREPKFLPVFGRSCTVFSLLYSISVGDQSNICQQSRETGG